MQWWNCHFRGSRWRCLSYVCCLALEMVTAKKEKSAALSLFFLLQWMSTFRLCTLFSSGFLDSAPGCCLSTGRELRHAHVQCRLGSCTSHLTGRDTDFILWHFSYFWLTRLWRRAYTGSLFSFPGRWPEGRQFQSQLHQSTRCAFGQDTEL